MSGALVRYAAKRGIPLLARRSVRGRYGRYATRAGSIARFAMINRGPLMKMAAGVRGRWKKGRARSKPFARRSYATPRQSLFDTAYKPGVRGYTTLGSKTLYLDTMDLPQQQERLTGQMFIKGLSLCMQIHNTADYPVEVHVAMIQFSNRAAADSQIEVQRGFFRADQNDKTDLNFENYVGDPNYDLRYLCNPLNPDNKKIIFHKKFLLGRRLNSPGGFAAAASGYETKIDQYFPLKRIVKMQNTDGGPNSGINEKPWVLCIWSLASDMDDHNRTTQQDLIKFNYKKKFYYKNQI